MDNHKSDDLELSPMELDKLENRHKVCAHCGKEFYLSYLVDLSNYAYKLNNPRINGKRSVKKYGNTLWFCSWSCLSRYRDKHKPREYKTSLKGTSISDRLRSGEK